MKQTVTYYDCPKSCHNKYTNMKYKYVQTQTWISFKFLLVARRDSFIKFFKEEYILVIMTCSGSLSSEPSFLDICLLFVVALSRMKPPIRLACLSCLHLHLERVLLELNALSSCTDYHFQRCYFPLLYSIHTYCSNSLNVCCNDL